MVKIYDHLLVFPSEEAAFNTLSSKRIVTNGGALPLVDPTAEDGKWNNQSTSVADISVSLRLFGKPEIVAPGFRLLVGDTVPNDNIWNLYPGVCEFVADRQAACDGGEFILKARAGRAVHAVLFSPVIAGSCYPDRVKDSFAHLLTELLALVPTKIPRESIEAVERHIAVPVGELDRLASDIEKALPLIANSNQIEPVQQEFLGHLLREGIRYLRSHPLQVATAVLLYLIGNPLYAAYCSVIEDLSKPLFLQCIETLLTILGAALA
ncbi:MAG: hypothetical protein H5U13_09915 [Parvibaculum sp.]|nr:hypothetical protein [Parvibaculum sp.]